MIDEDFIYYLTENPEVVDNLDNDTVDKIIAYLIEEIKRKEQLLEEINKNN